MAAHGGVAVEVVLDASFRRLDSNSCTDEVRPTRMDTADTLPRSRSNPRRMSSSAGLTNVTNDASPRRSSKRSTSFSVTDSEPVALASSSSSSSYPVVASAASSAPAYPPATQCGGHMPSGVDSCSRQQWTISSCDSRPHHPSDPHEHQQHHHHQHRQNQHQHQHSQAQNRQSSPLHSAGTASHGDSGGAVEWQALAGSRDTSALLSLEDLEDGCDDLPRAVKAEPLTLSKLLREATRSSEDGREWLIARPHVIVTVLELLMFPNADVQRYAINVLCNLCRGPGATTRARSLLKKNAATAVLELIRFGGRCRQTLGLQCLARLHELHPCLNNLDEHVILKTLTPCLEECAHTPDPADSTGMAVYAATVLGMFASISDERAKLVLSSGVLPTLVKLLDAETHGVAVRYVALTFSKMARADSRAAANLIAVAGGIPPLAAILELSDGDAQKYAADTLGSLANACYEASAAIMAANGLLPLINLLQTGGEKRQAKAVRAIAYLCRHAPEAASEIVRIGGLNHLVPLLDCSNDGAKKYAAIALLHLASAGQVDAVVKARCVPKFLDMLCEPSEDRQAIAILMLLVVARGNHSSCAHLRALDAGNRIREFSHGTSSTMLQHSARSVLLLLDEFEEEHATTVQREKRRVRAAASLFCFPCLGRWKGRGRPPSFSSLGFDDILDPAPLYDSILPVEDTPPAYTDVFGSGAVVIPV